MTANGSRPSLGEFPGIAEQDVDLGEVVHNLTPVYRRGNPSSQRDPNDPDVRWLLEAGVAALVERFCSYNDHGLSGFAAANDLLGAVSLDNTMQQLRRLANEHHREVGVAGKDRILRRWRTAADYQRDLIGYVFRPAAHEVRLAAIRQRLPEMFSLSFGEVVEYFAISETDQVQTDELLQLQLTLLAAFPSDTQICSYAQATYKAQALRWAEIYAEIAEVYRLELPSDHDFEDMARMFAVVVEGAYLRRTASTDEGVLHDGTHISVKMIQLLLSQFTGRPWGELARLTRRT